KLGRGGLSDVEWTVQLLQLQHAGAIPELRDTTTLGSLQAARAADVIGPADERRLRQAWVLATRLRNANVLATGRTNLQRLDLLPGREEMATVSRIMEYQPGQALDLEADWLRAARRCRATMERLFFG